MEELLALNDKETTDQAKNAVRTITDTLAKSKAYYNALGATVVMNYLKENGLLKKEPVNLHSSAKMLADFEIADIQLPNLHIDVRAVFDENEIFIPKIHFDYKFLPDLYLILKFDEDLQNAEMLGFVEPYKINKKNTNGEYYFVNKAILSPISALKDIILSAPEKTQYVLTEHAENSVEKLIMLYMDHDIEQIKLEKLLDYLKNSFIAREKLVEFENFERLSYMALKEFKDLNVENNDFTKYIKSLVSADEFAEFSHKDDLDNLFEENKKSGGLFIDDDIAEAAPVTEEIEAEVLPEAIQEEEVAVREEEPVVDEVLPVPDEFDAFNEIDEFDVKDEFSFDDSVSENIVAEELPTVDSVELEEIPVSGDVVSEELPVVEDMTVELENSEVVEAETVAEAETLQVSEDAVADAQEELPTAEELLEPVVGEDLEFHVDGMEALHIDEEVNISEEVLSTDENSEPVEPEISLEQEEPLVAVTEPEELAINVDEPELQIDENPHGEDLTLSEDTLEPIEELKIEEQPESLNEEIEPKAEDFVSDNKENAVEFEEPVELDFGEEIPVMDQQENQNLEMPVSEMVSDDEINLAIASSMPEEEHSASDDDLSLEELLNMENDLSAGDEKDDSHQFIIDDDLKEAPVVKKENPEIEGLTEQDLDFMSQSEDELAPLPVEDEQQDKEVAGEDEGTDFAFAVDSKPAKSGKSPVVPVLATVAVLGLAGAGAWYFLSNNGKTTTGDVALNNNNASSGVEDISLDLNENSTSANNDGSSNQTVADLQIPAPQEKNGTENTGADETLTIQKIKKDFSQPNTYLEVNKIVWDVPEYLTYNDDFSSYLQTLGSTLKLNLNSDLLLVSENVVFDKVRIKIGLKESGKKFSAEVVDGSGTTAVDELVLQSVKNTLNLLKPPVNSLDTADEDLYITIYL